MSDEVLIRKFFDAYNESNADAMIRLFADDATVEYVGGAEKKAIYKGKDGITNLFRAMLGQVRQKLTTLSCPKTLLAREGVTAVEWSTVLSNEPTSSAVARGVNVCEIENGKFRKMTVYLPHPTAALTGKLSIKDLGELSLMAWAIV